jgi:hypothetical protein
MESNSGRIRPNTTLKIPNFDKAIIAPDKLCNYLLNAAHKRGGSKAKLLMLMGYSTEDWRSLEDDLRSQHLSCDFACELDSEYGQRFEIAAPLSGPSGRSIVFRSIWQIDLGTENPRLITMYPEE